MIGKNAVIKRRLPNFNALPIALNSLVSAVMSELAFHIKSCMFPTLTVDVFE